MKKRFELCWVRKFNTMDWTFCLIFVASLLLALLGKVSFSASLFLCENEIGFYLNWLSSWNELAFSHIFWESWVICLWVTEYWLFSCISVIVDYEMYILCWELKIFPLALTDILSLSFFFAFFLFLAPPAFLLLVWRSIAVGLALIWDFNVFYGS